MRNESRRVAHCGAPVFALVIIGAALCGGCSIESEPGEAGGRMDVMEREAPWPLREPITGMLVPSPLPEAHCSIEVDDVGVIDMEEDYLPHVIQCENGGANLEALKAQAISARSVAYYAIETTGSICDSQGCQVYSCGATPQAIHYEAVEQTAGQYLSYEGTLTYGFYVAGDSNTAPPGCIGVSGATEGWVTYNEGRVGTDVEQTELGFVHPPNDPGYGQNRGCMSQWGARCLENDRGYDHREILRFYYGDDIELVSAAGVCVESPEPADSTDGSMGEVTDSGGSGGAEGVDGTGLGTETTVDPSGRPRPGSESDDDGFPLPGGTGASGRPTGGDFDPALPMTFGVGESSDDGCACRSSTGRGSSGGVPLLLLLVRVGRGMSRRRRRPTTMG